MLHRHLNYSLCDLHAHSSDATKLEKVDDSRRFEQNPPAIKEPEMDAAGQLTAYALDVGHRRLGDEINDAHLGGKQQTVAKAGNMEWMQKADRELSVALFG